ncbi:hypothetical protein M409DRAFT_54509 [Zasmidium cellare ATCC 36951]|uniref:FAD-binding domain-containing protein n=1 Tax=Zasmidium cellare ATCC 36951 TaxID=1080233 RepID=A0A6A6CMP4_ZASCE|nr:uncharacterized protein M409DRAFT_54509 [Zasmidium cellare ATCC 36951]KAF2166716.1 hypothetical protein M409DRAFT_54509 [Zasmidium cellare ATCC 36951]
MADKKILIVGASVAGPMAAFWLAKTGADITVVERHEAMRDGGQNVDIRTSGVTVVQKVPEMEARIRAAAAPLEGMSVLSSKGQSILTIKSTGDPKQQSLMSEYEIFRDDLSKILFDFAKDLLNVRYVFGEQAKSMTQDEKGVDVEFLNGHLPQSRYDLVVAADGATSRTRALAFDCKVRDHMSSMNAWAAYSTIKKDLLNTSKTGQLTTSTPGRGIILLPDHDSKQNRVLLMGSHGSDETSIMHLFRQAVKGGDRALKDFLGDFFHGHGRDDILTAVEQSNKLYASEAAQVKAPSLYKGRIVLFGDAGYAAGPVGTGTSLAITGAYVLAGEINSHPDDLSTALQNYSERMRPIIQDMQQIPPGFPGIMTPQTAWGLSVRNAVLRIISYMMLASEYWPVAAPLGWLVGLYASAFGKDKYSIPYYAFE